MDKPPVHWILDLVPLMALLLVSGFMYAFTQRRDHRLQARPVRKDAGLNRQEFSTAAMDTVRPRGGALSEPLPNSSVSTQVPCGAKAWDTLQSRLLQLAEQDERGGADIQELHRAVADYESVRNSAGRWDA